MDSGSYIIRIYRCERNGYTHYHHYLYGYRHKCGRLQQHGYSYGYG